MEKIISYMKALLLCTLLLIGIAQTTQAESSLPLQSVLDEAVIRRISEEEGFFLLQSDGYYCLLEDGSLHQEKAVHYFDHLTVGDTVFNGFYFHDEAGKWRAAGPALAEIPAQDVQEVHFEGWYMVTNLGRISGAAQVHYLDRFSPKEGAELDGFFYFDEFGRLITEPGVHHVEMVTNGRLFEGDYYFGNEDGSLVTEEGVTEDGYFYDSNGLVSEERANPSELLEDELRTLISGFDGEWSVSLKNLDTGETIHLNEVQFSAASLIKTYVMARTYAHYDAILVNLSIQMGEDPTSVEVEERLEKLLSNMITVSDNESFNELVRLQTASHNFLSGARAMNRFLQREGFSDTTVQSSLSPSSTDQISLGGKNLTSAADCIELLERIENGSMVSVEASESMKALLFAQNNRTKIPTGLPDGVGSANKTGETDSCQHDMAIVYGENCTFVICIMSSEIKNEGDAVGQIREIASLVYQRFTTDMQRQ